MVEKSDSFDLTRPELWDRIHHAQLPKRGPLWSSSSFGEELKKRHYLTQESAKRLEVEYRRFLYLWAISDRPLSVSFWVKNAWDLHEEATGNAWRDFCEMILGRPNYHRSGPAFEEPREGCASTLDLYRHEFGEEPPRDIWPGKRENRRALLGFLISLFAGLLFFAAIFSSLVGGNGDFTLGDLPSYLLLCLPLFALFVFGFWLREGTDLADERDTSGGWWG